MSNPIYNLISTREFSLGEFVTQMESMHPRLVPTIHEAAAKLSVQSVITEIRYAYPTLDEHQVPMWMSSLLLVLRQGEKFQADHLWLENRATQTADKDVPTHKWNIGEVHVLRHGALVSPDLMSFGTSIDRPICYCHGALAARNTVDAVIAAQAILQNELGLTSEPLPVLNSGHSQGGFDALAVLRYMETMATEEEKRWVRIDKTYCADGPYAPDVVTRIGCKMEKSIYGAYMLLSAISHMNYHSDYFASDVTIEDFLTEEARALHLPEVIARKELGNKELIRLIVSSLGTKTSRLFSESAYREGGRLYEIIMRCSEAERQTDGWKPTSPVAFYHAHADECVPVEVMYEAQKCWGNLPNVSFDEDMTPIEEIENGMAHTYSGGIFHRRLLSGIDW